MGVEHLQGRLEAYLTARLGSSVQIQNFRSISGGACQENYSLDLFLGGAAPGERGNEYRLVMRTDRGGALDGSLSRPQEYQVIQTAFGAGVPTPEAMWLEEDQDVIGAPFYFMRRAPGRADSRFIVRDRSLSDVREKITGELAQALARLHSVGYSEDGPLGFLNRLDPEDPRAPARDAVKGLRSLLSYLPEAYPALEICLNWLEANMPETRDPVLVHGDFRTGNFLATERGMEALLDWEFAHWGDRHEDLTWISMRDWRFGKINLPVGGISTREPFYEAYEKASGTAVDRKKALYWEVMGNVRWAAGAHQQAERHLSGQSRGIELASIGRRACEMEYEAMRLIEKGEF